MQLEMMKTKVENRQFSDQANLVYVLSIIATILFLPLFIYIGNLFLIILDLITILASFSAYILNKRKKYGLAAFIFISVISIQSLFEVIHFGMASGFVYYFFNMSILIIYTNWKSMYRFIGVIIQVVLIILSFVLTKDQAPIVILSPFLLYFFHISNAIFNVAGVANSANYHLKIVKDAQKALSKLAMTDYLSGLPNRTAFSILLDEKLMEAVEKKKSLGMMMIDVDHFKDLNDTFGHLCGDSILKSLSELLMSQKTGNELLARFGGEEFVFLEICDEEEALIHKAEMLRKLIESHTFIYQSKSHKVTVSIGALWISNPEIEESILYIDQADGLMYEAKQQGRNKVIHRTFYKTYKGV